MSQERDNEIKDGSELMTRDEVERVQVKQW